MSQFTQGRLAEFIQRYGSYYALTIVNLLTTCAVNRLGVPDTGRTLMLLGAWDYAASDGS